MERAFTLIELLVVITIIVVLLALLTPALDKAIYQAELATCGAQVRGVASGSVVYAMDHRRRYPWRGKRASWDTTTIKGDTRWNVFLVEENPEGEPFNIPGQMRDYVSYKLFVDPFVAQANLDWQECERDPLGFFLPGYHVYFDWGSTESGVNRMQKLGQKMVFNAPEGDIRRFGVLLADRDARSNGWSHSTHPDKAGVLSFFSHNGDGNPWTATNTENVYVSWWAGGIQRGYTDNNYGMDDGSVLRLDDVPVVNDQRAGLERVVAEDPRITFVPDLLSSHSYGTNRRAQLPRGD